MVQVAVVLSGCGHLDGSEIRESILTLLSLEANGIKYHCFAPNSDFMVTNHLTGQEEFERRSVISEAARIARGNVLDLNDLLVEDFAAIIIPGGYGAAKNLSDLAIAGPKTKVNPKLEKILSDFWQAKKNIAAICIAPAVVTAALKSLASITVTIGNDDDDLIGQLGGKHISCAADKYYHDKENCILSTPAYMLDATLNNVATGIDKMIKALSSEIN